MLDSVLCSGVNGYGYPNHSASLPDYYTHASPPNIHPLYGTTIFNPSPLPQLDNVPLYIAGSSLNNWMNVGSDGIRTQQPIQYTDFSTHDSNYDLGFSNVEPDFPMSTGLHLMSTDNDVQGPHLDEINNFYLDEPLPDSLLTLPPTEAFANLQLEATYAGNNDVIPEEGNTLIKEKEKKNTSNDRQVTNALRRSRMICWICKINKCSCNHTLPCNECVRKYGPNAGRLCIPYHQSLPILIEGLIQEPITNDLSDTKLTLRQDHQSTAELSEKALREQDVDQFWTLNVLDMETYFITQESKIIHGGAFPIRNIDEFLDHGEFDIKFSDHSFPGHPQRAIIEFLLAYKRKLPGASRKIRDVISNMLAIVNMSCDCVITVNEIPWFHIQSGVIKIRQSMFKPHPSQQSEALFSQRISSLRRSLELQVIKDLLEISQENVNKKTPQDNLDMIPVRLCFRMLSLIKRRDLQQCVQSEELTSRWQLYQKLIDRFSTIHGCLKKHEKATPSGFLGELLQRVEEAENLHLNRRGDGNIDAVHIEFVGSLGKRRSRKAGGQESNGQSSNAHYSSPASGSSRSPKFGRSPRHKHQCHQQQQHQRQKRQRQRKLLSRAERQGIHLGPLTFINT
ncbi:hypothetical protein F4809DRAFT_608156 [Biscogniauxia mediterranea]|nr:hypothetical protein F4809DRAFT_608156 [Biscogniauxia mediterranea]